MSAAAVSDAILHFSSTHTYPDDEALISADLPPVVLNTVLNDLRKQRDALKQEIRTLSKTNGAGVEGWIDQAKRLQKDIQASRETARKIVEQHAEDTKLKAKVHDAQSKASLLEREIRFEASLESVLLQVKEVHGLLLDTQDAIVQGQLPQAYERLETAKSSIVKLGHLKDARCVVVLRERGQQLQKNLAEAVTECWHASLKIDAKQHELVVASSNSSSLTVEAVVQLADDLNTLNDLASRWSRDIERAILKPLFRQDSISHTYEAVHDEQKLSLRPRSSEPTSLFSDLRTIISFLSQHLPQTLLSLVLAQLMPKVLGQIEDAWLTPLIPLDAAQILDFEKTIADVKDFAEFLDQSKIGDARQLHEWLNSLPKNWLTKRREALLGEVRNIVFQQLHQRISVERVETQTVAKDELAAVGNKAADEDDWDNAWDDEAPGIPAEPQTSATSKPAPADDEDDGSAWDVDDSSINAAEETSAWDESAPVKPPIDHQDGDDGGEEAWGWGDEPATTGQKSAAPTAMSNEEPISSSAQPKQHEITFRETYTVTAVPDHVLQVIQGVIFDAQELVTAKYSASTLASAAVGLYSLPTLALAIYRATAPTAYAKLTTGNMLIYNDATRLSERLREWQASQPPASRLRLDNDAKALDVFAKRAYSTEMELQRTILRDALEGAQGFNNCTTPPFKQACESAIEETADRLQYVHREWKSVLGQNALLQSLGQLLSGTTGKMIADVEDLSDIGEADSQQLKLLCERLSVVKALFAQQQPDGELRDMTFVYCPNWLKFQYLAEILESSLADIKFLWNEGELSLEFSAEEVVDLIKALFAESEHRRKLIGELRRQSRR